MQPWVKNLAMAWLAQLICMVGFGSVFPFLPFYVQHLGVTDPDQVKLWAGWITTGGSLSMAIMAPVWGALADRHGRKMMVQRAAFAGAASMMLMSLVTNAPQLLALRTIQGIFTGTIAAFTALVASTTPRDKAGFALGLMQVAVYVGNSGGPLVGGFLADALGYRRAFMIGGLLLLVAGFMATFLLKENFVPRQSQRSSVWRQAGSLLTQKTILAMVGLVLALYFTGSVMQPILPLFIQSLVATEQRLASTAGTIQGASALSAAVAAAMIGRISDRFGHRRVLITAALGVSALYIPMMFVTTPTQLLIRQIAAGIFVGGIIPATNAFIALYVDEGKQGATYGLTASAGAAGRALGPMVGSLLAISLGMRALFPIMSALYLLIAILAATMLPKDRPAAPQVA